MEPRPSHAQAPAQAQALGEESSNDPVRCRRCFSGDLTSLKKARRNDNDVYRCKQCSLLFSPFTPQPIQTPAQAGN